MYVYVCMMMMMYPCTTVLRPHVHWQLQELLGNPRWCISYTKRLYLYCVVACLFNIVSTITSRLVGLQIAKEGDTVVDATCGLGKDSVVLANLVGPTGKLHMFDIQECAITATQAHIQEKFAEV